MSNTPKQHHTTHQLESERLNRHQWISVAAYYKAEARGFKPGKALDDWLEAENEYIDQQIASFSLCCQEDGGYTIVSLQALARSIGIDKANRIHNEIELVRQIQQAAQHRPCFRPGNQSPCEDTKCQWRTECRKLIAVWKR